MKREPVLIVMSVLAGLQFLTAGAALGDVIGLQWAGFAILVVGALQSGVQFYVRGQVTPNETVAAKIDTAREEVVAGPAAEEVSDAEEGDLVTVEAVSEDADIEDEIAPDEILVVYPDDENL